MHKNINIDQIKKQESVLNIYIILKDKYCNIKATENIDTWTLYRMNRSLLCISIDGGQWHRYVALE